MLHGTAINFLGVIANCPLLCESQHDRPGAIGIGLALEERRSLSDVAEAVAYPRRGWRGRVSFVGGDVVV